MPRLETVALIASLALAAGMVIYVQFFAFIEVPL